MRVDFRGRTLVEGQLLALAAGIGVGGPSQRGEGSCADKRVGRSLARLAEMNQRRGVADFVFGVSELEQHRRSIGRVGWLVECATEQRRGGVWCAADQRGPRRLTQHGDDIAVTAWAGRQQMHRDRAGVGALISQQSCGACVQVGLLGGRQIFIDRRTDHGVDETKGLSGIKNREVNQARRQRTGLSRIHPGQPRTQAQPGLLAEHGHRSGEGGCLRIETADAEQYRRRDALRCEPVHRLRVDLTGRSSVAAIFAEEFGE